MFRVVVGKKVPRGFGEKGSTWLWEKRFHLVVGKKVPLGCGKISSTWLKEKVTQVGFTCL